MNTNTDTTINFGGVTMSSTRYARISRAHQELTDAVGRAGAGPRAAAVEASAKIWRELGPRHTWSAADLKREAAACTAAMQAHPDYPEWIRLSREIEDRIAANRAKGRPLLAYTDSDWSGQ